MAPVRYAVWRRRQEDPRKPRGWIIWGDRHMSRAQRIMLGQLIVASIMGVAMLTVLIGGVGLIVGPLLAWLLLSVYARPGAREHAELPDLGGENAFPVTVEIWKDRRKVGVENGWVAFAEGWLVYEGMRTSFSVRSSDVHLGSRETGQITFWYAEGGSARIRLLTDFMQTNRPAKAGAKRQLDQEHAAWRAGAVPVGKPIYPPCERSPRILGERIAERSVGGVLFSALSVLLYSQGHMLWVVPMLGMAIFCFVASARAFRVLRKTLVKQGPGSDDFPAILAPERKEASR